MKIPACGSIPSLIGTLPDRRSERHPQRGVQLPKTPYSSPAAGTDLLETAIATEVQKTPPGDVSPVAFS